MNNNKAERTKNFIFFDFFWKGRKLFFIQNHFFLDMKFKNAKDFHKSDYSKNEHFPLELLIQFDLSQSSSIMEDNFSYDNHHAEFNP